MGRMDAAPDLKQSFLKLFILPALTFFLMPLGAVGFAAYGEAKLDGLILDSIDANIAADTQLDSANKAAAKDWYRAHPPSAVCTDPDPELEKYREAVCSAGSETWQFLWAERLGLGSAALGLFAFLFIGVLGLIAYRSPRSQYWTFMLGWRGLVLIIALEAVGQGVLAVWLSYWVTALLMNVYAPKLILVVAVLALAAVWTVLRALFRALPPMQPLEAELIAESDAPALWGRVRQLATRLGTEPPRTIVAGIDDNFFVTERGIGLTNGQNFEGRVLYLSLPLMRVLSPSEADAVFSHELAHFRAGDTEALAKLSPALVRYEQYWVSLMNGGITVPAARVMSLFRATFELALKKEQRQRELVADAEAAKLTSPDDLGRSLLKVAGYSSFRNHTENELFDQQQVHTTDLGLRARIDAGLPAHVATARFLEQVKTLRVPHPFDSHPPLDERFANVKSAVRLEDAAQIFEKKPERTWADEVLTGDAIEQRLWAAYEARFKQNHELSLAYRYQPANDEERRLVLRFFPDVSFAVKDGGFLRVTYLGLTLADGKQINFADIHSATIEDGNFSTQLVITHGPTNEKSKVNLGQLKPQQEAFKQAFGQYWHREKSAQEFRLTKR